MKTLENILVVVNLLTKHFAVIISHAYINGVFFVVFGYHASEKTKYFILVCAYLCLKRMHYLNSSLASVKEVTTQQGVSHNTFSSGEEATCTYTSKKQKHSVFLLFSTSNYKKNLKGKKLKSVVVYNMILYKKFIHVVA